MSSRSGSGFLLPLLFVLIALLNGCSEGPEYSSSDSENSNSVTIDDGTEAMVARLARIAANQDPGANEYANRARVEFIRNRIPVPTAAEEKIAYDGTLAQELVYAGDLEPAIELLNSILQRLESNPQLAERQMDSALNMLGLAYLRLGEQQNCIINHSSASCLFPISGDGIHTLTEGSEKAMEVYERILNDYRPEDMEARWLLNVAAMTLGQHPDGVDRQWLIPGELFESDDTITRFPDIAPYTGLAEEMSLSGGSVTEDFNGDGFIDIMVSSWGPADQMHYFENSGDGTFINKTNESGLTGITGGLNLIHADYNNDGHADVFVMRGAWLGQEGLHPNSLLRNNGDGTFSDVTESAGLLSYHPTQTAVWADFNNDGWLDLFIGNESSAGGTHPSELFLSNRDGTFRDIADEARVAAVGFIKGVTAGDFNNDGTQDLYISRYGSSNLLFRNEGPGENGIPEFSNVTREAGVAEPVESFPVWFWDFNNDGWLDLFVSGYYATPGDVAREYLGEPHEAEMPRLYRNNGDGTFTNIAEEAGLNKVLLTMGSNFGDLDNDGYPDFYAGTGDPGMQTIMPNRMFRNHSGREFKEVTTSGGFGHLQKGHGVSFADLENDGNQDIFTVMGGAYEGDVYQNSLFYNPINNNNWITLLFHGRESNRAGIGNRVSIEVETPGGNRVIHQVVTTGGSFGSSTLQLETGLGNAERIIEIRVLWPASGKEQVFQDVELNGFYSVNENSDQLTPVSRERINLRTSM